MNESHLDQWIQEKNTQDFRHPGKSNSCYLQKVLKGMGIHFVKPKTDKLDRFVFFILVLLVLIN